VRKLFPQLAAALILVPGAFAQDEEANRQPTWQDKIAKGFLPYHQLTLNDFRIDEKAHPETAYWITPFIDPHMRFLVIHNGDWYYAYVQQWVVFSGFDKNKSSRKSSFRESSLVYAQASLDLSEIYARQLAAIKPGEFPSGRGATPAEAIAALRQNVDEFLKEKQKALETDAQQFQKGTSHGINSKKVRELATAIRKRLDATPAPTGPGYELPAVSPSASPAPQTASSPK
jgi:hypothetical protein